MSRFQRHKPPLSDPAPPLSPLPPPAASAKGVWKWAVPMLICAYCVLASLHAALVPVGQTGFQNAPDEAAHVRYVRSLAAGHLPTQAEAAHDPSGQSYEWHQPPLYYAWTVMFLPLGAHGMRLSSILLGIIGILLIYRAARLLFPENPMIGILAVGVAALLPTHVAITSTINNDVLLEVCFSATLLLLMQILHNGLTLWRAGWLGFAVGAALLTKATGLLLLPVLAVAFLMLWRAGEPKAALWRSIAWCIAVLIAISGWWFVRNQVVYGQLLPMKAFEQAFAGTALTKDLLPRSGGLGNYCLWVSDWTFQSFWAVYGNLRSATVLKGTPLFLPEQVYILPFLVTLIAAGGFIRLHFIRHKQFTPTQLRALWILMTTFGLVAISFLLFLTKYFQTQGRYLFPAMMPFCLLLTLGWEAAFPVKYRSFAAGALLGMLVLLSLLFLVSVQAAVW